MLGFLRGEKQEWEIKHVFTFSRSTHPFYAPFLLSSEEKSHEVRGLFPGIQANDLSF